MSLKAIVDEYTLSQRRLLDDTEKVYSRLLDALAQERNALKTITDERDTLRPLSGVLQDARRINDDLRAQLSVSQKAVTTLNSELIATKEALRVAQRAVAREAARASETTWCVCDGSGQFTKRRWINDKMMQEVTEKCPAESHFETVGGCVVGNSAKAPKGCTDCGPQYKCTCVDPKTVYDEVVRCGGTTTMEKLIAKFGEGADHAVGMCTIDNSLVVFRDLVSVTSRSKATKGCNDCGTDKVKNCKCHTNNYWSKYPTAAGGGSTGASGLHVPEPSKKPTPPAPAPAQVAHVGGSFMDQVRKAVANPPPPVTSSAADELAALKTLAEVPDDLMDDILKQATDDNIKKLASLFMTDVLGGIKKNSETQQLKDDLEKACNVQ